MSRRVDPTKIVLVHEVIKKLSKTVQVVARPAVNKKGEDCHAVRFDVCSLVFDRYLVRALRRAHRKWHSKGRPIQGISLHGKLDSEISTRPGLRIGSGDGGP